MSASDIIGGPPPATEAERERWQEWNAETRAAGRQGEWLTDTAKRDDYPGTDRGWKNLVDIERRMKALVGKRPPLESVADEAPSRSRIPEAYRDMDAAPDWLKELPAHKRAMEWASEWHSLERPRTGLLILGPTGTGKTGIATAVASMCGEPNACAYWPVRQLLTAAKNDFLDHRETTLESARRTPLLVLDDLGVERRTEWNVDTLGELIEHRHAHGRAIVVTSNLPHNKLAEHLGVAGHNRTYSRLVEVTEDVVIGGTDRRVAA